MNSTLSFQSKRFDSRHINVKNKHIKIDCEWKHSKIYEILCRVKLWKHSAFNFCYSWEWCQTAIYVCFLYMQIFYSWMILKLHDWSFILRICQVCFTHDFILRNLNIFLTSRKLLLSIFYIIQVLFNFLKRKLRWKYHKAVLAIFCTLIG